MLETLKDRSQRFTTTEIQAEILRQDIQKLENAQPLGDNDLRRLKILKQRMADIEEPSKLNAQGRVLMRRYLGMMNEDRTWIDGPSNVDACWMMYASGWTQWKKSGEGDVIVT